MKTLGLFLLLFAFLFSPGLQAQTRLWGLMSDGGAAAAGTITSMNTDGSDVAVVSFPFNTGRSPYGSLLESGGKFYGVTIQGGSSDAGVLFEYDPAGSGTYTIKHEFNNTNGSNPYGSLIESGGKFYGTTHNGGSSNAGVLFEYDPAGSGTYTVKHEFNNSNGGNPYGNLLESGGKFYGMTYYGGSSNAGVLFEYDPAGSGTYTVKHEFNNSNGGNPYGSLIESGGKFYGMTEKGGSSDAGVLFEYNPAGSGTYTVKHEFDGTNGGNPDGSLLESGGKFYGMTYYGGSSSAGVLFEYDPAGSGTYTVKHHFDYTNGGYPYGNLLESGGKFYGVAGGGSSYAGVLFEYDPAGSGTYTVEHEFYYPNGHYPNGYLIESGGKFYGMTTGDYSGGSVLYEYDPAGSGAYAVKFWFNTALEGQNPYGSLIESGGKFYGMTLSGGILGLGVLLEYDPAGSGTLAAKYEFDYNTGYYPRGSLLASGGKFYGMTHSGGSLGYGVLFEYDPAGSGTYTVKHEFDDLDGGRPLGSLIESGGKFYGMTNQGGSSSAGVLFEYDPSGSGTYTVKHHFDYTDGGNPEGSLLASGGKFYGMTNSGGPSNEGVLFEYDPAGSGTYTVKHLFTLSTGRLPRGSLLESGGKFYGMTGYGGSLGYGVLFEYDPAGSGAYTVKHEFDGTNGGNPGGSLIESGGKFYGMTNSGGNSNVGVAFEYDPAGSGTYTVIKHLDNSTGNSPIYGQWLAVNCTPTTEICDGVDNDCDGDIDEGFTTAIFSLTGGGAYCSGGAGVAVGLADSETGVSYQLNDGTDDVGAPVAGTGDAISFGNITEAGTYTVVATGAGNCPTTMTDNAIVTVNPSPATPTITGDNSICPGESNTLSITEQPGATYCWTSSNVTGCVGTDNTLSVSTAATYTVTVDLNGCTAMASETVTVDEAVTSITLANPSACNGGGTTCEGDDTFTADIVVNFSGIPATGVLSIASATLVGSSVEVPVASLSGNSYTFQDAVFKADGTAQIALAGGFSASPDCGLTNPNAGATPSACSGSGTCGVTGISLANTSACNNPGNTITAADDNFTTDVTVTFAYAPASGDLTLKRGTTVLATKPAAELACVTTWTFDDVTMSADGAGIVLTAEFSPSCTYTSASLGNAPAPCSCVPTTTFTVCPGVQNVNVEANSCAKTVTYSASANGEAPTYSYAFSGAISGTGSGTGSGASFPKGTTTVTLTATNACGSTNNCSFTVTVTDNVPPSITCPGNVTENSASNACGSTATWVAPTGADNCTGANTTSSHTPGAFFATGPTTVTYTVTDGAGLTSACSFTVTVNDGQNPSVVCPMNIVRSTDAGQCTAVVIYANPTSADNCSFTLTRTSPANTASGSTFAQGTTVVSWKATDPSGNSAVCDFTVTVNDAQAPAITCPANIVRNTDAGQCYATVNYSTPTFSDNCTGGGVSYVSGGASGSAFQKGTNTVIWKATDAGGLSNTCAFTVTVNDSQLPSIGCPSNISRNTDAGQCHAAVTYSPPTASDNCTGVTVALQSGLPSSSNFPKGVNTVVWKATDAVGLTKTCSFRVTVNDGGNPVITCPTVAPTTTAPTSCTSAPVNYPAPTATDNCPGAISVVRVGGLPSGSSFPLGSTNVTWRAIDAAGRSSTCSFAVAVTDATVPVITCPGSVTVTGSGSPCVATVGYATPTGTDNCGVQSLFLLSGQPSGSTFPAGATVNVWRAIDNAGLSATCSFTVTVGCGASPGPSEGGVNGAAERDAGRAITFTPPSEGLGEAVVSSPPLRGGRVGLFVSPNPATSEVRISAENLDETGGELRVLDAQGRLMWRQRVGSEALTSTLELDDRWQSGVYFVTLRSGGEVMTKRLVVTRQ